MKFDVSNNELRADGGNALAAALKGNQVITELSIASNWLSYNSRGDVDMSGVNAISDVISDMGALSVLNLASNNLGELVLPEAWTKKFEQFDGKRQWVFTHADGTKQIEHPGKPEGIIALGNAIPDMRALTSLNLASNVLGVKDAKIIAACLSKCT
jgi:hypothetical protein